MPEKVIFHVEDCCVAIGIAVLDQFVGGATTVVAERDGSGGYTVTGQAGIDQICRDNSAAVEEMLPCREYHFEVLGRGTVLWRYEEGRVQSQEPSGEWHTHGAFTGVFNAGRRYEALRCGYPDIDLIRATRDEFARQCARKDAEAERLRYVEYEAMVMLDRMYPELYQTPLHLRPLRSALLRAERERERE